MKYFLTCFSFLILVAPTFVLAQYQPLVGIPGVNDTQNFDEYLQAIYATAISLAALLAVIKIVIAGVKWMTTDIVTSKSAAKMDIQGAIFGLLVILGAVLILYIINPNIGTVNLSFTPAPTSVPATGGSILTVAAAKACQDSSDCTFTSTSCAVISPGDGSMAGPTAGLTITTDCTPFEEACLGDSLVSDKNEYVACLTTDAQTAAALATAENTNCPTGESCTTTVCTGNNCEASCMDNYGVYFDTTKNICVKNLATAISNLLTGPTLNNLMVSDSSTINGFAAASGYQKTYYLAQYPGSLGPSGNAANAPVSNTMTQLCSLVAENERDSSIKKVTREYNGLLYGGCLGK